MKKFLIAALAMVLCTVVASAQNTKEEDPETQAHKQTEKLVRLLNLSDAQEFYVDSILVSCFTGHKADLDDLERSGRNDWEIYRQTSQLWQKRRLDALKKVLDEQQYIKYLRSIGLGKEYKKGKDGKWYLKSDLKKK